LAGHCSSTAGFSVGAPWNLWASQLAKLSWKGAFGRPSKLRDGTPILARHCSTPDPVVLVLTVRTLRRELSCHALEYVGMRWASCLLQLLVLTTVLCRPTMSHELANGSNAVGNERHRIASVEHRVDLFAVEAAPPLSESDSAWA
jgi:hypothetical protein